MKIGRMLLFEGQLSNNEADTFHLRRVAEAPVDVRQCEAHHHCRPAVPHVTCRSTTLEYVSISTLSVQLQSRGTEVSIPFRAR